MVGKKSYIMNLGKKGKLSGICFKIIWQVGEKNECVCMHAHAWRRRLKGYLMLVIAEAEQ